MCPAKIQISLRRMHGLIRIFTGRILITQRCKVSSCDRRRHWSDCADTQADLSLRWGTCQLIRILALRRRCLYLWKLNLAYNLCKLPAKTVTKSQLYNIIKSFYRLSQTEFRLNDIKYSVFLVYFLKLTGCWFPLLTNISHDIEMHAWIENLISLNNVCLKIILVIRGNVQRIDFAQK